MLLALIDTGLQILWVDVGNSGSLSGAQIFNCSKLKKIEDGTLGLPAPELLGDPTARNKFLVLYDFYDQKIKQNPRGPFTALQSDIPARFM